MALVPKNPLTSPQLPGTPVAGNKGGNVGESDGMQWSKRYQWATCRDLYRNELDTIGSHWIEGTISNEELAFEIVKLLSEVYWVRNVDPARPPVPLDDVVGDIRILSEAMLSAALQPESSPALRREFLDFMKADFGKGNDLAR